MQYIYWLCGLSIKAEKKIQLIYDNITARRVYELNAEDVSQIDYLEAQEKEELLNKNKRETLLNSYVELEKNGIQMITIFDPLYPSQLKMIFNPPLAIFVKGSLPKNGERNIAIVGARTCSPYGETMAKSLAKELGHAKVNVISGLALGVDAFSHRGALDGGGKTFAVLGCGCDAIYPTSNRRLYEDILNEGGGIISEYVPGTKPLPLFFPGRNRIISGLSSLCVIVEARIKSGSLITADFAMEQGRDVFCFPGRCTDKLSDGCNRLIAQGAGIITDINSFLQDQGIIESAKKGKREKGANLTSEEAKIYKLIDFYPKNIAQIMLESGCDQMVVMLTIMSLIEKGYVRELFKNSYVKR